MGLRSSLSEVIAGRRLHRRDLLTPPSELQNIGEGDFGAVGEVLVYFAQILAELKSTDRVLDIGCGIGRMARVLARELRPPGSYDGFDVVAESIDWCQKHYRGLDAPFRFQHADLRNTAYNPAGTHDPVSYRFPYPDAAFDLVVATSVFTHLAPESADHYLGEARRVLAPGGRFLMSWFLLAETPAPAAQFDFHAGLGPAMVAHPENPEAAIAYPEAWLRKRVASHGLGLREPIFFGSWRGVRSLCYQDIVIADRVASV